MRLSSYDKTFLRPTSVNLGLVPEDCGLGLKAVAMSLGLVLKGCVLSLVLSLFFDVN